MSLKRAAACFGLAAFALAAGIRAGEANAWPGPVEEVGPAGRVESWSALGPLLFAEPSPEGGRVAGFRPFYVRWSDPGGGTREAAVLYPLFYYRSYGDAFEWSLFKLVNRYGLKGGAPAGPGAEPRTFDVWPLYFSRQTGDPATSRRALLPIAGTVADRFGYDRISWLAFPLYARTERRGAVATYAPWPVVRSTRGSERGFAVWPLYGREERPGAFRREYFLWPLAWDNTLEPPPGSPPGTPPTRQVGVLPFYTEERGPAGVNEAFLWPFFGVTDRMAPQHYHETRYFWPFLVQGRGDDRTVSRWGPFYTHSTGKGGDKTWILWPLFRRTRWTEGDIAQDRTQFLYFLYWRQEQRSLSRPSAAPAEKTYLWPLASTWDNGAGRSQVQVLSPLEGVFADNPRIRATLSPFFSIWRRDRTAPGEESSSLLWKAVTWRRSSARGSSEFHAGPLLGVETGPERGRIALLDGLVGLKRAAGGGGWRLFWLEFGPGSATVQSSGAK